MDFVKIRHELLYKPTVPEYQMASQLAKTIDINSKEEVNDPLVRIRLDKVSKWTTNLIVHYTHERRLATYNLTKELVRRRPQN